MKNLIIASVLIVSQVVNAGSSVMVGPGGVLQYPTNFAAANGLQTTGGVGVIEARVTALETFTQTNAYIGTNFSGNAEIVGDMTANEFRGGGQYLTGIHAETTGGTIRVYSDYASNFITGKLVFKGTAITNVTTNVADVGMTTVFIDISPDYLNVSNTAMWGSNGVAALNGLTNGYNLASAQAAYASNLWELSQGSTSKWNEVFNWYLNSASNSVRTLENQSNSWDIAAIVSAWSSNHVIELEGRTNDWNSAFTSGTAATNFMATNTILATAMVPGQAATNWMATNTYVRNESDPIFTNWYATDPTYLSTVASGARSTNAMTITKDPSGIAGDPDGTKTWVFDATNRTLTVSAASPMMFYRDGELITNSTSIAWPAIGTNAGIWYLSWLHGTSLAGCTQQVSQTGWALEDIQCATVYWSGGTSTVSVIPTFIIGEETHGFMEHSTHERFHSTDGSKHASGLSFSGGPKAFTNSSGVWFDEDIKHSVGPSSSGRTMYRNSGLTAPVFTSVGTQYPVTNGAGGADLMYDLSGTLTIVPTTGGGQYVNYFLYVVPGTVSDYLWVAGRTASGTLATLTAENPYDLTGLQPFAESVLLYKVTLRNSNPPTYIQAQDYRKSGTTGTSYSPTVHATLTGRDAADSHPLSAISSYETLVTTNDERVASLPNLNRMSNVWITATGVGVGTNAPAVGLEVSGYIRSSSASYPRLQLFDKTNNKNMTIQQSDGDFFLTIEGSGVSPVRLNASAPVGSLTLKSTGFLGIGTNAPATTLDCNGASTFRGAMNMVGNSVTNVGTLSATNVIILGNATFRLPLPSAAGTAGTLYTNSTGALMVSP